MADMNKIDEAIRKAKEAQKAKLAKSVPEGDTGEKVQKAKAPKMSDDERKDKTMTRAKELAEKKAARELAKAEKAQARELEKATKAEARAMKKLAKSAEKMKDGERGPAHMKKVEKAAAKLPMISDEVANEVSRLVSEFSVQDLSRLIAHLQHSNRVQSTLRSGKTQLEVGQTVRIVSCENDPGVIDRLGVVAEVRKIRVLVQVPGYTRNVYLFNSDCEPTNEVCEAPVDTEAEESVTENEDDDTEVEGVSVDEETGFLTVTEESDEATGTEG